MQDENVKNENEVEQSEIISSEFSLDLKPPENGLFNKPENEPENEPESFTENEPENEPRNILDDYARDDNGNIKRKKDGSPMKKRGRKKGDSSSGKKGVTLSSEELTQRQLATTLTGMVFATGQIIFDAGEWTPEEQEFLRNRDSLYAVLKKREISASEEMQCAVSFGTSILTRLHKEKTSAKIKRFFSGIFSRIQRGKAKEKMAGIFKRKPKEERNEK